MPALEVARIGCVCEVRGSNPIGAKVLKKPSVASFVWDGLWSELS
jgi:hypothetical protein